MLHQAFVFRVIRRQWRRELKGDLPLPQHVTGFILGLRLKPSVADDVEAKGIAVEVRRLPGIADEEPDVVDLAERKGIGTHG